MDKKTYVEEVDFWVQPFYEISQAGPSKLSPKERRFLKWLSGIWGKAVLDSAAKERNLFVLAEYPSINPEVKAQMEGLKVFARKHLGERFKVVPFSIAQLRSGRIHFGLDWEPFNSVTFSKENPIVINAWGEHKGGCPVREARILKSALVKAGLSARVVQRDERSVERGKSALENIKAMRKRNRSLKPRRRR